MYEDNKNSKNKILSKSGLRKLRDAKLPCMHPEHHPPMYMVYEPGDYEYICPACGHITSFSGSLITSWTGGKSHFGEPQWYQLNAEQIFWNTVVM
jgi:hypothetical protein